MARDLSQQAMGVIKARAQAMGLTQAALAEKLNVSLPTLKRWFGGGTITFESLQQLVRAVGLTLTDVFSQVEDVESETFHYTEAQERFFAENPDYLAYFDNLLRGLTAAQIQKKFTLSEKKTVLYLSQLNKLRLIEWLPKNKVRLVMKGEPVWREGGSLGAKLRRDIFQSFVQKENRRHAYFFLHDYTDQDHEDLRKRLHELVDFAKKANRRARLQLQEAKPKGLYLSLQDFRWNLDQYLKD